MDSDTQSIWLSNLERKFIHNAHTKHNKKNASTENDEKINEQTATKTQFIVNYVDTGGCFFW
jgi:hypothetical protein